MNIKELNKLIKEELDAFIQEDEMGDTMDMGDDIEVTTDEPDAEEDPLDLLRQIFDMLKPVVGPEGEVEDFGGEEEEDTAEIEDEESEEDSEEDLKEGVLNEALDPSFITGFVDTLEVIVQSVGGDLSNFANSIASGQAGGQTIPMVQRVMMVFYSIISLGFAGVASTIVLGVTKATLTPIVKKFKALFKGSATAGAAAGATDAPGETAMNEDIEAAKADPKAYLIDFFTKKAAEKGKLANDGKMNESVATKKIKGNLNESFDGAARFRKLANIK